MAIKPIVLGMAVLLLVGCEPATEPPPVSDSWKKIGADGQALAGTGEQSHQCVLDERTGLMWEVKREDGGLHDPRHTFSWFSTDKQANMSDPGLAGGGECTLSSCDTESFVQAVNEAGLCGFHDWHMPRRNDLLTLGDRRLIEEQNLVIDIEYFPLTIAGEYWTAETFRLYPESAWAVDTRHGLDRADRKSRAKAVRLARRHQAPVGAAQ